MISVDLIFADPPYYFTTTKGKRLETGRRLGDYPVDKEWDSFEVYESY
jgi:DNA modification methylase